MPDTPFEELEYLVDYLPDEGESIVVSRRNGELNCEPLRQTVRRDALDDPVLYGRLVQANERLRTLTTLPVWAGALGWFWTCLAWHAATGVGWSGWALDVGLGLLAALGTAFWIHQRQLRAFHRHHQPGLLRLIRQAGLDRHALLGVLRHHPELRTLFNHVVRWD